MVGPSLLTAVTRARLLDEMLGSCSPGPGAAAWSVLVMDAVTTRIMSHTAGIADVFEYGVSLVDDVSLRREPLPHLCGVYFLTPTPASVAGLIADWEGETPTYGGAHVFFASALAPELLGRIRSCGRLVGALRSLRELNVEYCPLDSRVFTTAQEGALRGLFGSSAELSPSYDAILDVAAARLATLFISLREMPAVRFRSAPPPGDDFPPGLELRLLAAQRLAVKLQERLAAAQRQGVIPEGETCELLVTDRSFDVVAPAIHEWTYEAAAHDLLGEALQGRVFTYSPGSGGVSAKLGPDTKEAFLDERDELFVRLRHLHVAAANMTLTAEMDAFRDGSGAVTGGGASAAAGSLDLRALGKLVKALPQYRDALARLGVHVEIASRLNAAVDAHALRDVGRLEQDLVFGDATSKEVIALLSARADLPAADRLRLLLCYSATHLEKLDATRAGQWQKVARLDASDLAAVANLEYLGVPVFKRARGVTLGFGRKKRRALRKDREAGEDDEQFALARFVPSLADLVEDASAARLSQDEYPYVAPPPSPTASRDSRDGTPNAATAAGVVASARTLRTGTWAKKGAAAGGGALERADSGAAGMARAASGRLGGGPGGPPGRRLFVFVLGGMAYSEMRVAHRLSQRLGRDVILGSTHVETPASYVATLASLATPAESLEIETPLRAQFQ